MNLDVYSRLDSQYFEFEAKLYELSKAYSQEVLPLVKAHMKKYSRDTEEIDVPIHDIIFSYIEKYKELQEYYQINDSGYLTQKKPALIAKAPSRKKTEDNNSMMGESGSMSHDSMGKKVQRANYQGGDFLNVFGATDRSAPDTNIEMRATMKQILKMMNSPESHGVLNKNSYLMKEVWKRKTLRANQLSLLLYLW